MTIFNVFNLAGGLALFLYGMTIMGSSLEKLAGSKMESVLQKLTSSTWRSVLLGAIVTGLIQSSSGTTVIVVGLVNSGIMQLSQAIGVIMGANIGTTVTGQLIRLTEIGGNTFFLQLLKPSTFAPIVAAVGAVFYVFLKSPKKRNIGQIMLGFGILFTGIFSMEAAVSGLRESETFVRLFTSLQNPIIGVLAGALVTMALQSSSASIGILQALSSTGLITWGSAVPIILGQNIGTCSTPMLASIGASKGAKRSAIVHLYFNIIGTVLFLVAIYGFKSAFGIPFWNEVMGKGDIANFHTIFNVVVTIVFLPFTKLLAKLAELTFPDKETETTDLELPVLDERLLGSPSVAIQQAKYAVEVMAKNARANCGDAVPVLFSHNAETIVLINQREAICDKLEVGISNYLIKITDKELSDRESQDVNELLHYVVEYERIGDYAINVSERSGEIFDKELSFSDVAKAELELVSSAICEIVDIATESFSLDDAKLALQVEPLEETIDYMIETLRDKHITRLKDGVCALESGIIFLEILTNLERISDHCSNIAARIIGAAAADAHFDAHELRRSMHEGNMPGYNKMLAEYRAKYCDKLAQQGE
ncbi:MAG: Na/Pi cotransporter family protein [Oscillospiraceae bacterium]|nr:Na/Pi cotransporter family protein [Oscillospiraceae bacterium]